MVDAVVSYVVQKLGDYLIQEAKFLNEVRDDMKWLQRELRLMRCFIKDAEEKQGGNSSICQWVSDIRDIAYDAEDVLDSFMLKEIGDSKEKEKDFLRIIKQTFNFQKKGKEVVNLYNLGKEIESLKNRIIDLKNQRERYGIQSLSSDGERRSKVSSTLRQLRRADSFAVGENVVGFKDDASELLAILLDKEQSRVIISIFGMGGLGKTTLAGKLYHDNRVKLKFNCTAWVSVSQDYTIRNLLLRMIKSFRAGEISRDKLEELEKMDEVDLGRDLHGYLKERRYLLVIDDVWNKAAWINLKKALPDDTVGSRVIITTRIREVADVAGHVHKLRFLQQDESWQLFSARAFQTLNFDKESKDLGTKMVNKCQGLPLAIVVLAGLLSGKTLKEWHTIRDQIWQRLREDSIEISSLLDLSFNDLSSQLQQCFLFVGVYPEDYEISMEKLIRLVATEDFIAHNEDQVVEDVVIDYLDQLINKSLIQVAKQSWGRIATCRVHDLLRDLAIQKAKDRNFFQIHHEINGSTTSSYMPCRRKAIYSWTDRESLLEKCHPNSRCLVFFNSTRKQFYSTEDVKYICLYFKSLRTLEFEGFMDRGSVLRSALPEEIGNLIHLKYLGLKNSDIVLLTEALAKLRKLQTLDMTYVDALELPTGVREMKVLRHIMGRFVGILPLENMKNLQTLRYVDVECWNRFNPEKLTNLRELCIIDIKGSDKFSFNSIGKLVSLQRLFVSLSESQFTSLYPLSHCKCLQGLRLEGKLENLPPNMHEFLPNLECLSLHNSELQDDPLPILEEFPKLTVLALGSYVHYWKNFVCSNEGFPRLESLQIDVSQVKEWQVNERAFPKLRGLRIIPEESVMKIAGRLRSIPRANSWEFEWPSDEPHR